MVRCLSHPTAAIVSPLLPPSSLSGAITPSPLPFYDVAMTKSSPDSPLGAAGSVRIRPSYLVKSSRSRVHRASSRTVSTARAKILLCRGLLPKLAPALPPSPPLPLLLHPCHLISGLPLLTSSTLPNPTPPYPLSRLPPPTLPCATTRCRGGVAPPAPERMKGTLECGTSPRPHPPPDSRTLDRPTRPAGTEPRPPPGGPRSTMPRSV